MTSVAPPGNRLDRAFAGRAGEAHPGVIPYVTAGFPRRDELPALLMAAQRAGCLAAEVGIPFSDPVADGSTVQATSTRALANGMTPRLALEQAGAARVAGVTIPLAVMVYANLVMARGVETFAAEAADAGIDALIVPDLPAGEAGAVRDAAAAEGLALIPMVAPTTPAERIAAACAGAHGFVYCVSLAGTTGARIALSEVAVELLERVRGQSPLPRALGFGISRREHVTALAGHAEAVVVGSALLDAIAALPEDPAGAAESFLLGLGGDRGRAA